MSAQTPNIDQAIAYYVGRLLFQYQKPKAQQNIAILANIGVADLLPLQVQDAYDPYKAVGPQLDVIGKYVGLPRNIGDAAPVPFFGFVRYDGVGDNPNGMTSYNTTDNIGVLFFRYSYQGNLNTALSDLAYAFMIAMKIVLNSNDGTLASIQQLLHDVLPDFVTIVDNADMTLTYSISVNAPVSPTVLAPYLPKPMGVSLSIKTFATIITGTGDDVVTDTGDKIIVNF